MSTGGPVPEIAPGELVRRIEAGEDLHVLDVRAPFRLESGRIEILPDERFHNVVGSELLETDDPAAAGIPSDAFVAVVCAIGRMSRVVTEHLAARGVHCASMTGGMAAWMRTLVPRELDAPAGLDRLFQIDRIGKGALGYVLIRGGKALVVDPPRHASRILKLLMEVGAELVGVVDTHAHADYISGSPGLARDLRVPYRLHPKDAVYPYDGTPGRLTFEPLEDGAVIEVGGTRVDAVHTPGHTEGHVSLRIGDDAVLTGDFVFVTSVGRPDLGDRAEEWTDVLWNSLERARAEWPESLRVLPAHYSSEDERNADRTIGRPFGELLRTNEPLGLGADAFRAWVLSRTGSFPDAYRRIKAVNVGLEILGEEEMDELEVGKNQCALG